MKYPSTTLLCFIKFKKSVPQISWWMVDSSLKVWTAFVVLMCIHCICPGLLRMTRLIRSHSQLNVPSGNISTFLRLKSIAIIFLRPSYTHTQCTHWDTCTRTHGYLHFFLFQLPFNLIGICVACCPLNNWLWMCTSVRNETICSFLDAHRISFSYSRLSTNSLIVLPPILLICGSFFWAFWFSEKIYTPMWYCRSTEAGTHMHRSPFYLAAAASWGCVMADTQLRGETHGCLHDAYMLTHRIHTHKCRRWLSLFRSRMQTHLAALCDWFRTDGAGVTVSDASLLMYPDEIITQPFCSSAGQPVS